MADRMATMAERLRQARKEAGYDSAQAAADAFGWNAGAYRHHENGTRAFNADLARKYGRAFKVRPGWLLGWEGIAKAAAVPDDDDKLIVNASVEAGVWRASDQWNDERSFVIENMPSPIPGAKRFGLQVVGGSMNEFYQPGTILDCVSIFSGGTKPQTGDHVIVECVRSDGLRELTVKEYREEDGRYWLLPRSTDRRFKPIEYAGPDHDHVGEGEVHVIAFVIASYPARTLDLMKRMGMVKPLTGQRAR